MTSPSVRWLERGASIPCRTSQVLAVCLAIGWALLIAARASQPLSPSRFECSSDPWDFLPIGEMLDPGSLAFLVEAHCANARYMPDGWIELRYGGARVDVELRWVDISGTRFFRVASIGGVAAP